MQGKISREKNIRRTVLVVEDERINRLMLGNIVKKEYEVLFAVNGVQALDIIEKNARVISLILLDILMPEMNGFQLLEILQEDETLRRIPVIVLTSEKSAEVKSLKLGAADFLSKPYDLPEVILAAFSAQLRLLRTALSSTQRKRMCLRVCIPANIFMNTARPMTFTTRMSRWMRLCSISTAFT